MYRVVIRRSVSREIDIAYESYINYFEQLGEKEKGLKWAEQFLKDYKKALGTLTTDPFRYTPHNVYPIYTLPDTYYKIDLGWFIALFTVVEDLVTVWTVRGKRSDFSSFVAFSSN